MSGSRSTANVSVALALLSVREEGPTVAISQNAPERLPATRERSGDPLDQLARNLLHSVTGANGEYIEQLYTFSPVGPASGAIIVSYLALAPRNSTLNPGMRWTDYAAAFERLGQADQLVLEYALIRLRAKIGYTTIAFHLMPESFTLGELQQTYERILSRSLDPRNFRRRMVSSGLVVDADGQRRGGSHRPAALYRFSGAHDPASYLTPLATGAEAPEKAAKGQQ